MAGLILRTSLLQDCSRPRTAFGTEFPLRYGKYSWGGTGRGRLTDEVGGIALQSLGEGPVVCRVLCQPATGLHIVTQGILGSNGITTSRSPATCRHPLSISIHSAKILSPSPAYFQGLAHPCHSHRRSSHIEPSTLPRALNHSNLPNLNQSPSPSSILCL